MSEPPFKKDPNESMLAVLRAGISTIPVFGGIALELMNDVIVHPAQKQRDRFMQDLLERLQELEGEGRLDRTNLAEDPSFRSAFISMSQQALREAEEEKLQYLRNFVLNTALIDDLDATLSSIVTSLLPRLSLQHVRALAEAYEVNSTRNGVKTNIEELERLLTTEFREPTNLKRPVQISVLPPYSPVWHDQHEVDLIRFVIGDLVSMGLLIRGTQQTWDKADESLWISPLGISVFIMLRDPDGTQMAHASSTPP